MGYTTALLGTGFLTNAVMAGYASFHGSLWSLTFAVMAVAFGAFTAREVAR